MRTKRVAITQAMTTSVKVKRNRPEGEMVGEAPLIPRTAKELNHVLDKWIGDGIVRPSIISRPPIKEE